MNILRFRSSRSRHTLGIVVTVLGMLIPTACARSVGEHSSWLWDLRVKAPPGPWEAGFGASPFVQQEMSLLTDLAYHNPFTGGAILLRVRPLWFRYGDFTLEDHARGVYRAFLEVPGNNLRPFKDGRFVSLEEAWQYPDPRGGKGRSLTGSRSGLEEGHQDVGEHRRIEIPLRGSISRPKLDEEAEARRIEEKVIEAPEEQKFGPEVERKELRRRLERERVRPRITQGTRAKIVLIFQRSWPSDLLYEFYFIDHELAYEQDLKAFDRLVESFEALKK